MRSVTRLIKNVVDVGEILFEKIHSENYFNPNGKFQRRQRKIILMQMCKVDDTAVVASDENLKAEIER